MTESDFNKAVSWVQQQIMTQAVSSQYSEEPTVAVSVIQKVNMSYSTYKESSVKKKKAEGIPELVLKQFEAFWLAFPGISRFEYRGKKFPGERVLKANKQVCLQLYAKIVEEVGAIKLLHALEVQLENIRIESWKTGQNRMQYLKSCEVYLRQRAYESWLNEEMPVQDRKQVVDTSYNG